MNCLSIRKTITNIYLLALYLCTFCLTGCDKQENSDSTWQTIAARNHQIVYRAKVPQGWLRQDPNKDESIADTMKPIVEFMRDNEVRVTVHTFPITDMRIPPRAQIARWQKQFSDLNTDMTSVTPISHDGFTGLQLEAEGIMKEKEKMMLGWSMILAKEYKILLSPDDIKRADYTIKVLGPIELVAKNKSDFISFANSFELIDEFPAPL